MKNYKIEDEEIIVSGKGDPLAELSKITWRTTASLVDEISRQYSSWLDAMSWMREEFKENFRLYRWERKDPEKDKLSNWDVFSTHSALMARSYIARPQSQFASSEISDSDWVKNLNHAFNHDAAKQDVDVLHYWEDFFKFLHWMSITAAVWWDWDNKSPKFEAFSPECWIPDTNWDHFAWVFDHTWFVKKSSKWELVDKWMYHKDLQTWSDLVDIQSYKNALSGVNDTSNTSNTWVSTDDSIEIYHHFWQFITQEGKVIKVHIILWNDAKLPLSMRIIKDFPFSFKYWNPDGTLCWMNVTKISWNAQAVKAFIWNLRLKKSYAELYPMYLADTKMLPNAADLSFWFNKVIEINTWDWWDITRAITSLQKDFRADNSMVIDSLIDQWSEVATSIWKVAKWSTPERREWVGTNKLVSDATDILIGFRAKVEAVWEKQFLRLWLRTVREKMKTGDTKKVNVKTSYWLVEKSFKKKDFILSDDLEIEVRTSIEIEEEKQKKAFAYGTFIGFAQSLGLPKGNMNYMYRKYWELIWIPGQEIERMIDYTPWEIEALQNVDFLNKWINITLTASMDIMANLSAIRAAKPWVNVEVFRNKLLSLYKDREKKWTLPEPMVDWQAQNAMANNMASQAVSNTSWMQAQSIK